MASAHVSSVAAPLVVVAAAAAGPDAAQAAPAVAAAESKPKPNAAMQTKTTKKKTRAQWALLKHALTNGTTTDSRATASVRHFTGFELWEGKRTGTATEADGVVYDVFEYTLPQALQHVVAAEQLSTITLRQRRNGEATSTTTAATANATDEKAVAVTASPSSSSRRQQLLSALKVAAASAVDNTGNVCVWPSEHVLAWLALVPTSPLRHALEQCATNQQQAAAAAAGRGHGGGARLCELGAGQTGFGGLVAAHALLPASTLLLRDVVVTDGNPLAAHTLAWNCQTQAQLQTTAAAAAAAVAGGGGGRAGVGRVRGAVLKWDRAVSPADIRAAVAASPTPTPTAAVTADAKTEDAAAAAAVAAAAAAAAAASSPAASALPPPPPDSPDDDWFDVVTVADCLFFTRYHTDLLHTVQALLGLDLPPPPPPPPAPAAAVDDNTPAATTCRRHCFIVGPRRGTSMDQFLALVRPSPPPAAPAAPAAAAAAAAGPAAAAAAAPTAAATTVPVPAGWQLRVDVRDDFDATVTARHKQFLAAGVGGNGYDPDLHQPLLVHLQWTRTTTTAATTTTTPAAAAVAAGAGAAAGIAAAASSAN